MSNDQGNNGSEQKFFERRVKDEQVGDKPAEQQAAPQPQQPVGPQVRAQITITLLDDGNCQVNGPFEDRLLFRGLLEIAADVERAKHMGQMVRANLGAQQAQRVKEPFWKRKMRERAERKAAELSRAAHAAAHQAANAAAEHNDELQKALAANEDKKPS